ncbi:MAG: hypothetical protein ACOYNR_13225 [Blastocatellia bacterium]
MAGMRRRGVISTSVSRRALAGLALWALLGVLGLEARAQEIQRIPDREVRPLLDEIVRGSDRVRESVKEDLQRGRGNGGTSGLRELTEEVAVAARRLRSAYRPERPAGTEVEELLRRAERAEQAVFANSQLHQTRQAWAALPGLFDKLAFAYRTTVKGAGKSGRPARMSDQQIVERVETVHSLASQLRREIGQAYESRNGSGGDWRAREAALVNLQDLVETSKRLTGKVGNPGSGGTEMGQLIRFGKSLQRHFLKEPPSPLLRDRWRSIVSQLNELAREYRLETI